MSTYCKTANSDWTWEWAVSDALEAKYPGSRAWMQGWSNPVVQIRETADPSSEILFCSDGDGAQIILTGHDFGDSQLDATDFTVPIWTWFISKEHNADVGDYEKRFLVAQVDIQGKTTPIIQNLFQINPEGLPA